MIFGEVFNRRFREPQIVFWGKGMEGRGMREILDLKLGLIGRPEGPSYEEGAIG